MCTILSQNDWIYAGNDGNIHSQQNERRNTL
nr:MAG TPA: hypothetical protein [Caudoviricetes sp.]